MSKLRKGNALCGTDQQKVLLMYVYRYTREHIPEWASFNRAALQFDSDLDWLENTEFYCRSGGALDARYKHCLSTPSWPDNPELRSEKGQ